MDLSLPGEDGLDLARKIRTTSQVPIIMVTGRGGTIDRIVGLEIGADDYLPKPFEPRELLARVKTVLRRFDASGNTRGGDSNSYSKATFGDWSLNLKNHNLISPEGVNTHLTSAEFDLLCVFINNPDRVLSRDRLIDLVYGREMSPFERSIDVLIMRLRSKIEKDRHNPSKIRTIRGQGYLFSPKVEWS
jgi:two-component system OmpR family response regulator